MYFVHQFHQSIMAKIFEERSIWFARLLRPLTAGDFGVHCWGFQVPGWDESPLSQHDSGGPGLHLTMLNSSREVPLSFMSISAS